MDDNYKLDLERTKQVEDALFQKAIAGDVRACVTWLKFRSPERWDATMSVPPLQYVDNGVEEEIERLLDEAMTRPYREVADFV